MREDTIRRLSTTELVRRLINNTSALFNREVTLAKRETKSDAMQMAIGSVWLVLGGLMLYTALAALVAAVVLAITPAMAPVTAALLIAAIFAVFGAIIALIGWSQVKVKPLETTRETLREDVAWARNQMKSPGR